MSTAGLESQHAAVDRDVRSGGGDRDPRGREGAEVVCCVILYVVFVD